LFSGQVGFVLPRRSREGGTRKNTRPEPRAKKPGSVSKKRGAPKETLGSACWQANFEGSLEPRSCGEKAKDGGKLGNQREGEEKEELKRNYRKERKRPTRKRRITDKTQKK